MIYAVVAEFNPFHNGHQYLVDRLKKDSDSSVIAIMSGSFVERGDIALIDKYARAEAAVSCGVDLVLELPAPWCFSGAEFFALGGVYVANGLGIVDSLAFGSESGDTNSLIECAERLSSVEFQNALSEARNVNQNLGTAALRAKIYTELYGENEHFNGSNDLLALEYIRALKRVESEIVPIAHKRIGEVYNSEELTEICSATAIRRVLSPEISDFSRRDLSRYMPKPSYDILMRELEAERIYTLSRLDTAALALLRTRKPEVFSEIMEASGGVENRLTSLANECRTIEELVASAKDKRYSESRIRRLLIASILGITMRDVEVPPEFTTVLAANSRGRELLALARKRASIDVLSKTSASKSLTGTAAEQYVRHMRAERLAELCCISEPRRVGAVMI